MAPPFLQTLNATGAATACILDWTTVPFSVSAAVVLTTGTATYGVQYTLDDVNNSTAQTVRWIADPTIGTAINSTGFTSYSTPVQAIRVNIASLSATGVLEFKVIQGYPP